MRTSVSLRLQPRGSSDSIGSPRAGGFTLLEMLVVLLIVALLSGLAAPRFFDAMKRRETQFGFSLVQRQFSAMRVRIRALGKPFVLDENVGAQKMPDGMPLLELPEGFSVEIRNDIRFAMNGACSGGVLLVSAPDGSQRELELKPPFCQPAYR